MRRRGGARAHAEDRQITEGKTCRPSEPWLGKVECKTAPEEVDGLSLTTVIHHRGGSGRRGHCYATVQSNEEWRVVNNKRVREVKSGAVMRTTSTSCMFFYNS